MNDLTPFEKRVLTEAAKLESFTPTALGMALGYAQTAASSRVAPALRTLLAKGALTRTALSGNRAVYALDRSSPLVKVLG